MPDRIDWAVRPAERTDRAAWERLYRTYGEFYGEDLPAERLDRVWGWIHDEATIVCLVVVDAENRPVGLAHLRAFARPLAGAVGGYLDDLFVEPAARGTGAIGAMLEAIREEGQRRGWSVVRWITAADNDRARAVYDRVAVATPWVTYDMAVPP
ncbi:MAG: GNAT family N-acetyltransferase [Jiangellaceae bacterium]